MQHRTLKLTQIIIPPHIHRITIDPDAIKDLAASIEQHGLINPITVVDNQDDTYTLRAGHCRFLAHQHLNRTHIEASIHIGSVRDTEGITFAENLHRTPLSPMEEAYAIKHEHEDNLVPLDQIARVLHRSTDWVCQRVALADLPDDLCELVHQKQIGIGSALALGEVKDTAHRRYLQRYALDAGASMQVIAEWVRQWKLAEELGMAADAPRPEMPQPGQIITITMPCAACGAIHPHTDLRILRICNDCTHALSAQADPRHSAHAAH